MSQRSLSSGVRLYRLADRPGYFLDRLESPDASIDLLPGDWNRGAGDHPDHQDRLGSPDASIDLVPDDWNRGAGDHPDHQVLRLVHASRSR